MRCEIPIGMFSKEMLNHNILYYLAIKDAKNGQNDITLISQVRLREDPND